MDRARDGVATDPAAGAGIARPRPEVDDRREGIAAELLADPRMAGLLAEALDLSGGDPDEAARLVRLRLRQGRPADDGARTTLKRAVALAVWAATAGSKPQPSSSANVKQMDGKMTEVWYSPGGLNGRASTSTARAATVQNATGSWLTSRPSPVPSFTDAATAAMAAMRTAVTKPKKPGACLRGTRLRSAAASIAPP